MWVGIVQTFKVGGLPVLSRGFGLRRHMPGSAEGYKGYYEGTVRGLIRAQ